MKTFLLSVLIVLTSSVRSEWASAQTNETASDSLPRLEIPEITIIGKKAITLPFARKGELYDVDIYQAPPPDSSLLGKRPPLALANLSLPQYGERLMPWRLAVVGGLGSFSSGVFRAYGDYEMQTWGAAANGGFLTSQGHTANASVHTTSIEANAYSLLQTDNNFLNNLRIAADAGFRHDAFGMFGLPGPGDDRRRDNVIFAAELRSVDQERNALNIGLGTKTWSVHDTRAGLDSGVTSVTPDIGISYATSIRNVRLTGGFTFVSSSVDYTVAAQTPSVLALTASARWDATTTWTLTLGGIYAAASEMNGESQTLIAPTAEAVLTLDRTSEVSFWWKPEERLSTYDAFILQNPYLARELALAPEKRPVVLGASLKITGADYSVNLRGLFQRSSNRGIIVADGGVLSTAFVDADEVSAQFDGTVRPVRPLHLEVTCQMSVARERGSSNQLPMVPIARLHSRGEYELPFPLSVWSTLEYWSQQNVDLDAHRELGGTMILGVGASSSIIPRSVLSLDVSNILNTSYEWWSGYVAPGRQVSFRAQVNIQ